MCFDQKNVIWFQNCKEQSSRKCETISRTYKSLPRHRKSAIVPSTIAEQRNSESSLHNHGDSGNPPEPDRSNYGGPERKQKEKGRSRWDSTVFSMLHTTHKKQHPKEPKSLIFTVRIWRNNVKNKRNIMDL